MLIAEAAPPKHAKCGRELTRGRGEYGPEWFCTGCFVTVEVPAISREEADEELKTPEGRSRNRSASMSSPAWTEQELRTWATWKEGDPVPGETNAMTEQVEGFKALDTRSLGARCIEQLCYLQDQAALLDAKKAALAEEAAKLMQVAKFCGATVPADLEALAKGRPAGKKSKPKTANTELSGDHACSCGRTFPNKFSRASHIRWSAGHTAAEDTAA